MCDNRLLNGRDVSALVLAHQLPDFFVFVIVDLVFDVLRLK